MRRVAKVASTKSGTLARFYLSKFLRSYTTYVRTWVIWNNKKLLKFALPELWIRFGIPTCWFVSSLWKSIPRQGMIGVEVEVRWIILGFQLFTVIYTMYTYSPYQQSITSYSIAWFTIFTSVIKFFASGRITTYANWKVCLAMSNIIVHLSSFTGKRGG